MRHGGPFVWLETVPETHEPAEHAAPPVPAVEAAASLDLAAEPVGLVEPVETPAAPVEPVAESHNAITLTWDDEPTLPEVDAPMPEATAPLV